MRIIAGKWRSRRLFRPKTADTRPVPDRLREALFDILGVRYETPGLLPPLRVADIFAGSGSMGLEALSRGAASCTFFERGRVALDALRRNVAALDAGQDVRVVLGDAWRRAATRSAFDLALLDPPYADARDTSEAGPVARFLQHLGAPDQGGPLVVLHHPAKQPFLNEHVAPWRVVDTRTYGTGRVTFFAR